MGSPPLLAVDDIASSWRGGWLEKPQKEGQGRGELGPIESERTSKLEKYMFSSEPTRVQAGWTRVHVRGGVGAMSPWAVVLRKCASYSPTFHPQRSQVAPNIIIQIKPNQIDRIKRLHVSTERKIIIGSFPF